MDISKLKNDNRYWNGNYLKYNDGEVKSIQLSNGYVNTPTLSSRSGHVADVNYKNYFTPTCDYYYNSSTDRISPKLHLHFHEPLSGKYPLKLQWSPMIGHFDSTSFTYKGDDDFLATMKDKDGYTVSTGSIKSVKMNHGLLSDTCVWSTNQTASVELEIKPGTTDIDWDVRFNANNTDGWCDIGDRSSKITYINYTVYNSCKLIDSYGFPFPGIDVTPWFGTWFRITYGPNKTTFGSTETGIYVGAIPTNYKFDDITKWVGYGNIANVLKTVSLINDVNSRSWNTIIRKAESIYSTSTFAI